MNKNERTNEPTNESIVSYRIVSYRIVSYRPLALLTANTDTVDRIYHLWLIPLDLLNTFALSLFFFEIELNWMGLDWIE